MPGRHLRLERGGERRLRVRWDVGYRAVRADLDGREVLNVAGRDALVAGQTVPLMDGTQLTVRLERVLFPALAIERDGQPVPGSDTDPVHVARVGAWVLFFIAAVFFLGVAPNLVSGDGSTSSALVGLAITVVFSGLGFALRRGHAWAALAGIGLEVVDGASAVTSAMSGDGTWFGVLARVAFVVILLRAWMVLRRRGPTPAA